jgi:hypothetical protein
MPFGADDRDPLSHIATGIAAILVVAFHYAIPLRNIGFDVNRYTGFIARGLQFAQA